MQRRGLHGNTKARKHWKCGRHIHDYDHLGTHADLVSRTQVNITGRGRLLTNLVFRFLWFRNEPRVRAGGVLLDNWDLHTLSFALHLLHPDRHQRLGKQDLPIRRDPVLQPLPPRRPLSQQVRLEQEVWVLWNSKALAWGPTRLEKLVPEAQRRLHPSDQPHHQLAPAEEARLAVLRDFWRNPEEDAIQKGCWDAGRFCHLCPIHFRLLGKLQNFGSNLILFEMP